MIFSKIDSVCPIRRDELRCYYAAYYSNIVRCNLCDGMEEIWRKNGGKGLQLYKMSVFS
jgi:hypothetical protein